ncbi:MAG: TlpA family protein disulfide reductase [Armatimonadetes bacterium]|nr:TlpA family protein disulfide reductase [Armatimonadota bacterium]
MMKRFAVGLAVLGLLAGGVLGQSLSVGDPAPKLAVGEFVKGEPVTELKAGTVYVVEFWATWCGPCKASIPHLTELAKQYKDVKFIGANVWERDQSLIKPFVAEMGDKMGYAVACDTFEGDEKTGQMAKTWMMAAGRNGIPCAFIINDERKIAWIGHPMTMDEVLPKVVAKTWDVAKAAADFKAEAKRVARQNEVLTSLRKPDMPTADRIKLLRAWFAEDPGAEKSAWSLLLRELAKQPDKAEMVAYLKKSLAGLGDDGMALWNAVWTVIQQPGVSREVLAVALPAARRADALLKGEHDVAAGMLCRTNSLLGNRGAAVAAGRRAVKLAEGKPYQKMFVDWLAEAETLSEPRPARPTKHDTLG